MLEEIINLIQNFALFSKQEQQDLTNRIYSLSETNLFKLKQKLLNAYKQINLSQKNALSEIEKFQHEKLTPLFQKKERESISGEDQQLNNILDKLENI